MSTSLVRVDAPLQQQPQEVRPVDWGNPLTHGLVFLAVPCGFAWWDCISRQIASPNANATTPFRARQTVDGNRASAISLVGSGVGGGTSRHEIVRTGGTGRQIDA